MNILRKRVSTVVASNDGVIDGVVGASGFTSTTVDHRSSDGLNQQSIGRSVPTATTGSLLKKATRLVSDVVLKTDSRTGSGAGSEHERKKQSAMENLQRDAGAKPDRPVTASQSEKASVERKVASTGQESRSAESGSPAAAPASSDGSARNATLMPLEIDVPSEINKYVIGARLGSGTCGVVHKALDNLLGREVAVKLSPVGEAQVSTGKVPGAQRAYMTEVHAAGRLRHPNIVTVYDAGQSADLNYIVMEAVEGHSLKHYGKGQTLLPAYRALEVICECCKALDYSHRQGILHRDIKPANVMISNDGSVKLLDFGIAVGLSEESGLDLTGPTLGTPNYMSPEQILGRQLAPSSDFYSLGTVLFELLTGKQLFKAKKVKDLFRTVVHQSAPQLYDFRPDLTRELSNVLDKALSKKAEQRYQSGMEMVHALSGFIERFKVIEELPQELRDMLPRLAELPFFESVNEVDIARLITHAELRDVRNARSLLPDGNFDRELLVLVDGSVIAESAQVGSGELSSDASGGGIRGIYGPGQCVGEHGFIHGARERLIYRALSDQRVLALSTDTLSQLAPKLHLHYYKLISDTLLTRMASESVPFHPDIAL